MFILKNVLDELLWRAVRGHSEGADGVDGALEGALEDVLGDEVTVDSDEEDAADDMDDAEMDMGDAAMDMDDEEPMMEADDEELEEQSKSDLADRGAGRAAGGRRLDEEEEVVNEVARRVAARLQQAQDQENLVNTISERIFQIKYHY